MASNVPLVSGSVGSFTAGQPSALGEIAEGLGQSGEILRKRQLDRLLQERASYDATAPMRQDLGLRIEQDPTLAQNPDIMRQVQALYQGSGIKAPISPVQPGLSTPDTPDANAPGGSLPGLNRPASGGVDPSALTGNSVYSYVQKNLPLLMSLKPEERVGTVQAAGVPVGPREAALLQNLPQQLPAATQQKVQESDEKSFATTFNAALKSGNMAAATAAVKSAMARASKYMRPEEVDAIYGPYLEQGVAELSPLQVATLAKTRAEAGKDDAQAHQINALLDQRLADLKAQTDLRHTQASRLRSLTDNMNKMLPDKIKLMRAQTSQALANAARMTEDGALKDAEAEWYADKADVIVANKGQDPRALIAGVRAAQDGMNNSQNIISQLTRTLQSFNTSLNAMNPTMRAQQLPFQEAIQKQIVEEQNRYNSYAQALQKFNPSFSSIPTMTPFQGIPQDSAPAAPAQPTTPAAPNPQPTGAGKYITTADLQRVAKEKFGGDVNKARASAEQNGYTIR